MNEKKQQLINFNFEKNLKYEDFYISKSNQHILDLFNLWPKWEKNFLNISGENFSGKSHLVDIFLKKYKGVKFEGRNIRYLEHQRIFTLSFAQLLCQKVAEMALRPYSKLYFIYSKYPVLIDPTL